MVRFSVILILCIALDWLGAPATARAQDPLAGCKGYNAQNLQFRWLEKNHLVAEGNADAPAQIDCEDLQLMADHLESFQDDGRVIATGHVVYVSGKNRIYAERMEFNTKTRTGTFFQASGNSVLRDAPDPGMFGTQEPDAFFWGDEIQKIGPKKYRIVRGGFTTCVQPTPRWELSAGNITLTLDDYALLKNAVLKVKNVPMFYLPAFYYPIQDDNRATGFLMPIYTSSETRGQQISNQFFWAISRSQDATIEHDWFSKTGQQVGGEYRYILAPGSEGHSQFSFLNEHPTKYAQADGTEVTYPGTRSYAIVGDLAQRLPFRLRARANANYTSSIVSQQRYHQSISQSTNRTRRFGGNLSGSWNAYSVSFTADRNDYFNDETSFQTAGSLPRVTVSRTETAIKGLPLYFGVNGEYATLVRNITKNDVKTADQGLTRFDVNPSLRIPFTKLQFFTVNSSIAWRGTYWTESLDKPNGLQVEKGIGRTYMDFTSRMTGPVFNRIFNRPSRKFKHVVEPTLTIQHITPIDNFDRIVRLEGSDSIVGGSTRFNYGVSNRLYAKKETSREVLSATISQNYYTEAKAAQYDQFVQSGYGAVTPTKFGPMVLQVRSAPTDLIQGSFRTEWDSTTHAIRNISAGGSFNTREWLHTTVEWTERRYIPTLPAFSNPDAANNYMNASATIRKPGHRLGGAYAFYYDLKRDEFLQQRYTAYYNSQCCGVAVEYQTYNLTGSFANYGVNQDHRFNLSFTLAGVGTFSNLFGAFGGQSR
jgi:LPS-assembly protein